MLTKQASYQRDIVNACFLTRMKNVSLCNISVRHQWFPYVAKTLNVAIFSNIVKYGKCQILHDDLLIELCLFISFSLTLIVFQGYSNVQEF